MTRENGGIVDLASRRRGNSDHLLERLFTEHGAALRGFLRGVMGADDELEDIIQELFLKFARFDDLRSRLPTDRSRWRSYLIATANNMVVDMQRHRVVCRNYVDKSRAQALDVTEDSTPESIAFTHQQLQAVQTAIADLRPRWRQAFILNRFKHQSYRQIAEHMGVSIKQVEKYMKNALIRVRQAVADSKGGRDDQ